MPGDGPNKACQFAGDRGGDDIGRLAGAGELVIAGTGRSCAFQANSRIGLGAPPSPLMLKHLIDPVLLFSMIADGCRDLL